MNKEKNEIRKKHGIYKEMKEKEFANKMKKTEITANH